MISIEAIKDLLRTREDGTLFHRESQTLEFKESYNLRGLAEYFRNKRQEEEYEQTGKVANGTPSIYKKTAIDYIIQIYNNEH